MHSTSAAIQGWLELLVQSLGNCPYAVLLRRVADGELQPVAASPQDSVAVAEPVSRLAAAVAAKGRLQLEKVSEQQILLGLPVSLERELWGVFICRVAAPEKSRLPLLLKKAQSGFAWLQLILLARQEQGQSPEQVSSNARPESAQSNQLLKSLSQLMAEASLRELAISLVNQIAAQLQATRVSLGLLGQQLQLEAVSFSASFDTRTASAQHIVKAMDEALSQERNLSCSANGQQAQGIHLCHQQLLQENRLQLVTTLLVTSKRKPVGAITIEHTELVQPKDEQWQFVQRLLELVAPLLQLKMAAESGLVQQAKTRSRSWLAQRLGERKLARKLLLAGLALFLLSLFIPVRYQVPGEAVLQGAYKNLVVSPQDGYLGAIKVRPGDAVQQGDLLAQLKDEDLYLERRKLASQTQQYQQEYDNALANANRVQAAIANAQIEQASAQLQLIEQELARTQLLAPVAGIVVSDDISQSLGAPVKQGQVLFEIAAATDFIVQILVDERDITSLALGQAGQLKLASLPGESFGYKVRAITPISQVKDGRNYFRVEAKLDQESQLLRPGMTGSARTGAERRLLGWIWFHDIWHWLRIALWW